MVTNAVSLKLEENGLVAALQECGDGLAGTEGDVILDLSSVRRIDSAALTAMTEFADATEAKAVSVALRGVNIDVYRVLKLARLAQRFSLVS